MTTIEESTVWARGRFDSRSAPSKLLFGRMYEDVSIELGAFRPGGRIFSIASAGCTAMELARHHEVVAVDVNPVQIEYARRRMEGDSASRGSSERLMDIGRSLAPLAGWHPSRLRAFLELDDPAAQMAFWRRHLDTRRFRVALGTLLWRPILQLAYARPFVEFMPRRLGRVMRGRMERCFGRHPNRTNPYAQALLLGRMPDDRTKPTHAVSLVHADAADYLESAPPASFDGFTLSNILDVAGEGYARRLFASVRRCAAPGAVLVIRSFREPESALAANLAAEDRAMLWGQVDVRRADT